MTIHWLFRMPALSVRMELELNLVNPQFSLIHPFPVFVLYCDQVHAGGYLVEVDVLVGADTLLQDASAGEVVEAECEILALEGAAEYVELTLGRVRAD